MVKMTARELMHLEDYLTLEQTMAKTLNQFANQCQDQQLRSMLNQFEQKCQSNYQRMTKHLSQQNLQ